MKFDMQANLKDHLKFVHKLAPSGRTEWKVKDKWTGTRKPADSQAVPAVRSALKPVNVIKKYKCGACGKQWRTPSELVKHTRIHTGEKPFSCDECEKSYRSQSELARHKKTHTKEGWYKCPSCPLTSSRVVSIFHL